MTLINGEFEFRGLQFGSERSGYPLREGGFSVGAVTYRDQDQDNPSGNGRVFGQDSLLGSTYNFDLWVIEEQSYAGWGAAANRIGEFRRVWHGSPVAQDPRAVDELLLWHGATPGLVYGRARNFAEDRQRLRRGYGAISCDFAAADDLVYDPTLEQMSMTLAPASGGGFTAPFVFPLAGQGVGSRQGFFTVGGGSDTPAMLTFHGPITNPRFTVVNGWTMCLQTSIPYDQAVTIDARMWKRSITRAGSEISAGGWPTKESAALEDMLLSPGSYEAVFEGIDPTNSATVSLAWHNARHSV